MDKNLKVFAAELIGTAVLMIGGPGSAILAAKSIGVLGVALAFGLSLLVLCYAIGGISGLPHQPGGVASDADHQEDQRRPVRPVRRRPAARRLHRRADHLDHRQGSEGLRRNEQLRPERLQQVQPVGVTGAGFNLLSTAVVEIVLTALLCFVVLASTHRKFHGALTGLAVGLTLTLIHLVSIPVDNTSVNPARSFGAAIFAGSDALKQLWAFILFPLVGAVVGVLVWLAVDDGKLEDTMLGGSRVMTDGPVTWRAARFTAPPTRWRRPSTDGPRAAARSHDRTRAGASAPALARPAGDAREHRHRAGRCPARRSRRERAAHHRRTVRSAVGFLELRQRLGHLPRRPHSLAVFTWAAPVSNRRRLTSRTYAGSVASSFIACSASSSA